MLAEAIHSVADAGNQGCCSSAARRPSKEATEEHPFGYGRERYIYASSWPIVLFSRRRPVRALRGLPQVPRGPLRSRRAVERLEAASSRSSCSLVAIVLESLSFRTAIIETEQDPRRARRSPQFIRRAKQPELPVILLEDLAALLGLVFALVGVGLSLITGNQYFDVAGTALIGLLLVVVAVIAGDRDQEPAARGVRHPPRRRSGSPAALARHRRRRADHPHEDAAPRPGGAARRGQDRRSAATRRPREVAGAIDAAERACARPSRPRR